VRRRGGGLDFRELSFTETIWASKLLPIGHGFDAFLITLAKINLHYVTVCLTSLDGLLTCSFAERPAR
jgi:hypothetical protein